MFFSAAPAWHPSKGKENTLKNEALWGGEKHNEKLAAIRKKVTAGDRAA